MPRMEISRLHHKNGRTIDLFLGHATSGATAYVHAWPTEMHDGLLLTFPELRMLYHYKPTEAYPYEDRSAIERHLGVSRQGANKRFVRALERNEDYGYVPPEISKRELKQLAQDYGLLNAELIQGIRVRIPRLTTVFDMRNMESPFYVRRERITWSRRSHLA